MVTALADSLASLPPTALEALAVGLALLALGALIKFREWTFLVAGYDSTSPLPDEVVADLVGNTVIRVGLALGALGVLEAVADPPQSLWWVFEAVVLLAVARLLYRLHTHPAATDPDTA